MPFHIGIKNITGMLIETDLLVVGGGPAGCACAWKLASTGRNVVLADRCAFPRPKLCGGALSDFGANLLSGSGMLLPQEITDLVEASHGVFSCFDSFSLLRTWTTGEPKMLLVDRMSFDSFLLRRAAETGARILTEWEFQGFDGQDVAVFKGGGRVRFRRMVGADGADSLVRRRFFGRPRGRHGLCLETFIPLAPAVMERFSPLGLQIHFGILPYGYGWVFPRREDLCVGFGSFAARCNPGKVRKAFESLLEHLELGSNRPYSGGLVPPATAGVFPGRGRVLLAGDAAGLCDRVSGEGIAHALESGFLSAVALTEGADTWNTKARCVRQVARSGFYRHLIYGRPFRDLAMKKLAESDRFQQIYWSIVSGRAEYSAILQGSRARIPSAT